MKRKSSLFHRMKTRLKSWLPARRRGKGRARLDGRWWAQAVALTVIWGGVGLAVLLGWYAYDLPDIHEIEGKGRRASITVLANDGSRIARFGDYFAAQINAVDMPKTLINAVIAVEDRRFFDHMGVDPWGIMRAMFANLRAGHMVQGGSTITQQLAKNLFLSPARTMRRKIQEMLLAFWLEYNYSKQQILTAYLNRVYLGAGSYGAGAAAETYFGKQLKQINLYESAVLAGLLKAPSRYAPTNDPEAAHKRASVVLAAMVDAGFINPAERSAALADGGKSLPPAPKFDGRYFASWIMGQAQDYANATGQDIVVQTTLDPKLQGAAERALDKLVEEAIDKKQNVSQAALLSLSPDGAVRAWVGGYDYDSSEFDRVADARRQPGSSFKVFVYLAAAMAGLRPDSTVYDGPIDIGDYAPDNYQGKYFGATTAREALARSMNSVAVKLIQNYGVDATRRAARKLGISSPLGRDLSLSLGTSEVSLYEMTAAYAGIAAGGRAISPYAIISIKARNGRVLYQRSETPLPQVVPGPAVASLVTMMQGVLGSEGTGGRAAIGRPAAGKTGTTQNYHDAWFIGFTADYVTGVWFGNDDNRGMRRITGGMLPARLWRDYMLAAHAGLPVRNLPALEDRGGWAAPDGGERKPTDTGNAVIDVVDEVGNLIGRLLGGR